MAIRVRRDGPVAGDDRRGLLTAALAAVLVALLLPLASFLVGVWLLGWQLQTVLSGSMSPTYPVGSLLVVGQIDAADVRDGMAITFVDPREPGRIVTHRVVGRAEGSALMFVTQGDANRARDVAPVPARMVRGRVLWAIPMLGTLVGWLQWPTSFVVFVILPGAVLALLELRRRRDAGAS